MPPHPSNTRRHQLPHDLQPHGGSLHDPNPNTLATTVATPPLSTCTVGVIGLGYVVNEVFVDLKGVMPQAP